MNHILQKFGPAVVEQRFGKALGQGLYEFRLDLKLDELLRRLGRKRKRKLLRVPPGPLLLRVFFHVYGNKIILLLGGYDKAKRPSRQHQREQISIALSRLARWKARQVG